METRIHRADSVTVITTGGVRSFLGDSAIAGLNTLAEAMELQPVAVPERLIRKELASKATDKEA